MEKSLSHEAELDLQRSTLCVILLMNCNNIKTAFYKVLKNKSILKNFKTYKLYRDNVLNFELGYQSPESMVPTLMHTTVIGNRGNCLKRVISLSRGTTFLNMNMFFGHLCYPSSGKPSFSTYLIMRLLLFRFIWPKEWKVNKNDNVNLVIIRG